MGGQEFEPQKMGSDLNTRYRNLYNGNIAHMGTLLPKIKGSGSWTGTNAALTRNITPEMLGNVYHYDQLNRITKHYAFDNYNAPTGSGTGNWQNGGPSMGTAEHHETFAYDGSGNIARLARNSGTAPAAGGTTGQVGDGPTMDNLTYRYHTQSLTLTLQQSGGGTVSINVLQNNKLYTVNEAIHSGAYLGDIDDQGSFNSSASTMNTANNYGYDKLGNLVRDNAEEIAEIGWTSTGKIEYIKRSTGSKKPDLRYGYDATGTRLFKVVQPKQQSGATAGTRMSQEHWDTTWYIKDASGNAMATYTTSHQRLYTTQPANSTLLKKFTLDELHIYGSQRHGLLKSSQLLVQQEYSLVLGDVMLPDSVFPVQSEGMFSQIQSTEYGFTNYTEGEFSFTRGHKQYELSNHLGNVLVTIQDRKWGRHFGSAQCPFPSSPSQACPPQTNCDYYLSYVVTITDYHAFGSTITERSASFGGGYRFGFNTQEKEVELGDGVTTAEFWMYDGKLGRRWNVDPRPNVSISVFACFGNNPVLLVDINGDSTFVELLSNGKYGVIGGNLKGNDNGIYLKDKKGGKKLIAYSATPESFYNSDLDDFLGIIDTKDQSGKKFLNKIEISKPSLPYYAWNATSGEIFDFKQTNGTTKVIYKEVEDFYRGMPLDLKGDDPTLPVYGSARDVGNIAPALLAGMYGKTWEDVRFAFDFQETRQRFGTIQAIQFYRLTGLLVSESSNSQYAQRLGFRIGNLIKKADERRVKRDELRFWVPDMLNRYPEIEVNRNIIKRSEFKYQIR